MWTVGSVMGELSPPLFLLIKSNKKLAKYEIGSLGRLFAISVSPLIKGSPRAGR